MNVYTWMFVQKNLFPYDRIIEAFEVIVVSTVQNENFTEILIEENDVALLAERVRLSYEGFFVQYCQCIQSWTTGNVHRLIKKI